jgi:hypothetical protein
MNAGDGLGRRVRRLCAVMVVTIPAVLAAESALEEMRALSPVDRAFRRWTEHCGGMEVDGGAFDGEYLWSSP